MILKSFFSEEQNHVDGQEIVFSFNLRPHGWSEFRFWVDGHELRFRTTHLFNNPLADLLQSLTTLLAGSKNIDFFWFDEPGTVKVEMATLPDQPDLVHVHLTEHDSTGTWNDSDKTLAEHSFGVQLQHLGACLYGEMVKLNELMKLESFAQNRRSAYPTAEMNTFMQAYRRRFP
ncbi:MAG: hypothetical protein H6510_14705 [Acidobacteria bacterium]|nr:hypothetical protein [Acidobacteriota bacterium]